MRPLLRWSLLGLLLGINLLLAATLDRRDWPGFLGDEATYLMQAASLAHDFDLRYERADYDRFVATWGRPPEGLILQSKDQGVSLTFGKPYFYPLYIAPFVRLWPRSGAAIANALLLALVAIATALALRQRVGPVAPVWVATFLFASVTFAHTLWAHADLFLMCLTALALSLAYGGRSDLPAELPQIFGQPEPLARPRQFLLRWLTAGVLLAIVAFSRPFYLALLLALFFAIPRGRRRVGGLALATGALLLVLLVAFSNQAMRGSWTSYGGERLSFYSYTGFPTVELPASQWSAEIAKRTGPGSWVRPGATLPYDFEPRLTAYNLYYFCLGRDVGLLPYFLPVLLGLAAFRCGEGRLALLAAVALGVACFFFVRPFNFYGGGGALANRYFLPLYPAVWFLAARPVRGLWVPVAALAGLFLWPLWSAPQSKPLLGSGGLRYVSPVAQRWLPYETTQSHLKPSGQDDVLHRGLWIKPLSVGMGSVGNGGLLRLRATARGELLVGSPRRLAGLTLRLAPPGAAKLRLRGGSLRSTTLLPGGGSQFDLALGRATARHRMWWSEQEYYLYRLHLDFAPGLAPDSALDSTQGKIKFTLDPTYFERSP